MRPARGRPWRFKGSEASSIARLRLASAGDEAFLFQRLEVANDAVGRPDAEGLADFADRRPVAAVADFVADEFVDVPLPVGQFACGVHEDTP